MSSELRREVHNAIAMAAQHSAQAYGKLLVEADEEVQRLVAALAASEQRFRERTAEWEAACANLARCAREADEKIAKLREERDQARAERDQARAERDQQPARLSTRARRNEHLKQVVRGLAEKVETLALSRSSYEGTVLRADLATKMLGEEQAKRKMLEGECEVLRERVAHLMRIVESAGLVVT